MSTLCSLAQIVTSLKLLIQKKQHWLLKAFQVEHIETGFEVTDSFPKINYEVIIISMFFGLGPKQAQSIHQDNFLLLAGTSKTIQYYLAMYVHIHGINFNTTFYNLCYGFCRILHQIPENIQILVFLAEPRSVSKEHTFLP